MGNTLPTADKSADEPEVTKDVTVEGYFDGVDGSWRDFMSEVVPDVDWYETSTTTSERKYLVLGDDNRVQLSRSEASDVQEALASDPDSVRGVRVEKETKTDTSKRFKKYQAGWKVRDRLMDNLPDEIAGLQKSDNQYKRSFSGDCVCSVSASIGKERILQRRETRTQENRYESDKSVWTVTVNFSLGEAPKHLVDKWSEAIVGPASTQLGRMGGIGKVRVATCTEERRGDCFV